VSRVLVTGASGFVGRPLVAALAADGMDVVAGTRRGDAALFPAGVKVVTLPDFDAPIDWRAFLEGADAIVHLAGIAHIGPGVPEATYDRVNRAATAELSAAAAAAKVRRFIFVSSLRAQTGPAGDRTLTERDEPQPTGAYGRSKLAAEEAVRASGLPFTILRPALVHGPHVKGNLASLIKLATLPVPLPFGAFQNRRSLVALDNLIAAIRFALKEPAAIGETFIVTDPQPISFAEIVTVLRAAMGRGPGLFPVPPALFSTALKLIGKHDMWDRLGGSLVADPAKLMSAGWKPVIDTKAGLTQMAQAASPRKSGTASRSTP
jgi:UDP-glucose 4-epimerase